jgi:predicted nucleic acid-binding protein
LADGELEELLAAVADFSIEYQWDDAWLDRALEIARSIGASRIYDSLYLACAEANNATLYTCDASFVQAFGTAPSNIRLVG